MAIAYRRTDFVRSPGAPAERPLEDWTAAHPAAAPADLLSSREREIANLVAIGLSNKAIGRHLGISHWTVSTHLRRVFAKLDINSRIELCRLVIARVEGG